MFGYYTALAARGLRNQFALTILMIGAIAVGIGASMTTLTVYRSVSADPIPGKSSQLFTPQIDTFGPAGAMGPTGDDGLQDRLSYKDAKALLAAHAGFRQVALYTTRQPLIPSDVNDRGPSMPGFARHPPTSFRCSRCPSSMGERGRPRMTPIAHRSSSSVAISTTGFFPGRIVSGRS